MESRIDLFDYLCKKVGKENVMSVGRNNGKFAYWISNGKHCISEFRPDKRCFTGRRCVTLYTSTDENEVKRFIDSL